MASFTIHGGISGIGGNKILVEDKETRVWLDFGESFGAGEDFFAGFLQPRAAAGARDYFEFGLLPKIPGLYSREALRFTDLRHEEPEFDAVVVSHPHYDHISHLAFVDGSIPVHVSRVGKAVIDAWEQSSPFAKYGEHNYRIFDPGKRIKIGSLEIETFEVDHSIPGACGFIVYTSAGPLVYSGDFRKHGPRAAKTLEFLEAAAGAKPAAMLCEGTRVSPSEDQVYVGGEEDVRREADKVVSKTNRIAVATFYPRDADRIKTFSEVARDNGRDFVIPADTALLLAELRRAGFKVPKPGDYKVYARRKKEGAFEESDYYVWERRFLKGAVNFDYVHENQSKVLLYLGFYHFAELVDIRPSPGGHFIHSRSEPMSEEEPEARVMPNWLEHFKLQFHQIHASGHCSKEEIEETLRKIRPNVVYPIHSEYPELFKSFKGIGKVVLPELKKKYEI